MTPFIEFFCSGGALVFASGLDDKEWITMRHNGNFGGFFLLFFPFSLSLVAWFLNTESVGFGLVVVCVVVVTE